MIGGISRIGSYISASNLRMRVNPSAGVQPAARTGAAMATEVQPTAGSGAVMAAGVQSAAKTGAVMAAGVQSAARTGAVMAAGSTASPGTPVEPVSPVPVVETNAPRGISYLLPFLREGADPAKLAAQKQILYMDPANPREPAASGGAVGLGAGTDVSRSVAVGLGAGADASGSVAVSLGAGADVSGSVAVSLGAGANAARGVTVGSGEPQAVGADDVQKTARKRVCQTCKKRRYQDGSDDAGVSFKTPTRIAPEQAAAAVRGHEQQHVARERAAAAREDRRVVSQTVTIHTAICPECGKAYIAGGTTRTTTVAEPQSDGQETDPQQNGK